MGRLSADLLNEVGPRTTEADRTCPLQRELPCCKGRGLLLRAEGPFTRGQICECLKTCPDCLGGAQKLQNGRMRPCRRGPSPRKIINIINESSIPARYVDAHFGAFNNFSGNGRKIRDDMAAWAESFRPGRDPGVILAGPVGVGKTFLIISMAKALAFRGIRVKFIDFFQLLYEIRALYSENRSDQEVLAPLQDVDVLFIDEMGKGRNTDFELMILDQLVMGRYNQNKTIVASTNCSLSSERDTSSGFYNVPLDRHGTSEGFGSSDYGSLEGRVGERIYSRLMETTVQYHLKGSDYRRSRNRPS